MAFGTFARKPEIMSPAGHWPQLQAAVEAGADAVYFGLTHFTARAKVGFSLNELPEVMRTLHRRGVKGYVTFNSLVFDEELGEAARCLARIAEAGADAIIVQDLGMVRLAKRIAPALDVHGSTQMSLTNAEGINFAQSLGVSRVVLARELSLPEVRQIHEQTTCELEVFVHGALCVSYSGQCFSSEAWGGRSANRGQCAQACRLPYELIVDKSLEPLGDARYLLSPGDLFTLHQIPEIVRSGVAAMKIEGRYKDADYVAITTAAYRKALDEAWAGLPLSATAAEEQRIEQVYSRGMGPYFVSGTNHQVVVEGRAPRHRGVRMGVVTEVRRASVVVRPGAAHAVSPLKPGDGVVFDAADWRSPEEDEEGGRVYHVTALKSGALEVTFGNGEIDFSRIRPGDLFWRTHDPEVDKAVKAYTEAAAPVHRQRVSVHVTAREGEAIGTVWSLVERVGVSVEVHGDAPLIPAQGRVLDEAFLAQQFGRLGNTPYALVGVTLELQGAPFVPASALNQIRRVAVERLIARQEALAPVEVHDPAAALEQTLPVSHAAVEGGAPRLHLLVRTPEQLEAALLERPASITLDYLDLYGLKPSVERVREAGVEVRVAGPRVVKPGEERIVEFLLRLETPILVRSNGLLEILRRGTQADLIGDFSLNAANAITADLLVNLGLKRLTPTYDLNAAQIARLAESAGAGALEVVAFQHLPVFHTEHCVFCRFLSTGTSYKDCGRPCESHVVSLRDQNGRAHPVMADVGCRNTVFGAEAQEASRHLRSWLDAGIRHFRLEFVHQSGKDVGAITQAFRAALEGRITFDELASRLKKLTPQGTTQGSLFIPQGDLRLPILQ